MNTIYTIECNDLTIAVFTNEQSAQCDWTTFRVYGAKGARYTLKAWHSKLTTYTECEIQESFIK